MIVSLFSKVPLQYSYRTQCVMFGTHVIHSDNKEVPPIQSLKTKLEAHNREDSRNAGFSFVFSN